VPKVKYTIMPKTARGVSREKAEEVRRYVNRTGHRAKVVRAGKDKFKVYSSSPSIR